MDITSGMILGIVYVAAPGPITIETLRKGMKGGFVESLAVQTGSALGLICYALLALFGSGLLLRELLWQLIAGVSGTTVLIYLGITTIRDRRKLLMPLSARTPAGASTRRAFWTGAILSLANPLDIIFWLSIGSHVFHDPGQDGVDFFAGFFVACILTSLAVALFAGFWQSRLTSKAALALAWICGLALIGFGLRLGLSISQHLIIW